jgi:hypothetical protein
VEVERDEGFRIRHFGAFVAEAERERSGRDGGVGFIANKV